MCADQKWVHKDQKGVHKDQKGVYPETYKKKFHGSCNLRPVRVFRFCGGDHSDTTLSSNLSIIKDFKSRIGKPGRGSRDGEGSRRYIFDWWGAVRSVQFQSDLHPDSELEEREEAKDEEGKGKKEG